MNFAILNYNVLCRSIDHNTKNSYKHVYICRLCFSSLVNLFAWILSIFTKARTLSYINCSFFSVYTIYTFGNHLYICYPWRQRGYAKVLTFSSLFNTVWVAPIYIPTLHANFGNIFKEQSFSHL